jgi:hypothetical protein
VQSKAMPLNPSLLPPLPIFPILLDLLSVTHNNVCYLCPQILLYSCGMEGASSKLFTGSTLFLMVT